MNETAEIKLTIRGKNHNRKKTICAKVLRYDRQLAIFGYNGNMYFAGRVENKDGSEYFTAEIPEENLL